MRLETERLVLRDWMPRDYAPYARMLADPYVRRFYPSTLSEAEAYAMIDRYRENLARDGFGFLVVERKKDGAFLGDVGISKVPYEVPGNPEIEIGWLLGKRYWGHGYAPEAALACLDHAWREAKIPEVVAFTYEGNTPSQRVMQKIGMTSDPTENFNHPKVPRGHKLRPHVLYRIKNPLLAG
ncbi:GNAT family N-acetyltransferase [Cucumibacter marinus]|uniref:GNAT family N-acetyltransferase n=1 Tax=Cucumibacter marinus TaxID=1121252 RepID=UPI0004128ACD|nr:GNAT family N-acetyltransferase [Cucumibacter marinus]